MDKKVVRRIECSLSRHTGKLQGFLLYKNDKAFNKKAREFQNKTIIRALFWFYDEPLSTWFWCLNLCSSTLSFSPNYCHPLIGCLCGDVFHVVLTQMWWDISVQEIFYRCTQFSWKILFASFQWLALKMNPRMCFRMKYSSFKKVKSILVQNIGSELDKVHVCLKLLTGEIFYHRSPAAPAPLLCIWWKQNLAKVTRQDEHDNRFERPRALPARVMNLQEKYFQRDINLSLQIFADEKNGLQQQSHFEDESKPGLHKMPRPILNRCKCVWFMLRRCIQILSIKSTLPTTFSVMQLNSSRNFGLSHYGQRQVIILLERL